MLAKLDRNKKILASILCVLSIFSILLTYTRVFKNADLFISDRLYQQGNIASGKIVLTEIDEKTLSSLGSDPLGWKRSVYADLLNILNEEENRPAVIGMDILFAHRESEESDEALVEAASKGNVVLAGMYYYGNQLETKEDGSYIWKQDALIDEAMPYEELKKVTKTGIVNLVSDKDGKVRHMRLYYPGREGKEDSFALQIAKLYAQTKGIELKLPDSDDVWLDFTYPAGGYLENISLVDVLNREYPLSYFKDKIVLIGSSAASMKDEYLTAADVNKAMNGVEIHANYIESLLRGEYYKEVSDNVQRIMMLGILFAGALAYLFFDLKGMIFSFALSLLVSFGICFIGYRSGFIFHPLYVPLGAMLQFVVGIASRFVEEAASRRRLRRQFEQYVDPAVLKKILDNGGKDLELSGQEKDVAVLFVDICGFTTLSEKSSPEKVVDILNHYLNMVTDCIMKNGGTLDKFIGDCAMAFWNAPYEQEDPIGKAIQAGFDMIEGAEKLNKELGFDLGFAIGINYGKAVIGNIGSFKRMDFTAIGDCVNTASRLESLKIPGENREGKIYLSEEVYELVKDRYPGKDLGLHSLKGKEKPIRIYALG